MTRLANRFAEVQSPMSNVQCQEATEPWTLDIGLPTRILNQLARELLLAQSSDWAFQIYQGTTVEYSSRRFRSHIQRFDLLAKMLEQSSPPYARSEVADASADAFGDLSRAGAVLSSDQLDLLTEIEYRDNIFSEIDYRVYCG